MLNQSEPLPEESCSIDVHLLAFLQQTDGYKLNGWKNDYNEWKKAGDHDEERHMIEETVRTFLRSINFTNVTSTKRQVANVVRFIRMTGMTSAAPELQKIERLKVLKEKEDEKERTVHEEIMFTMNAIGCEPADGIKNITVDCSTLETDANTTIQSLVSDIEQAIGCTCLAYSVTRTQQLAVSISSNVIERVRVILEKYQLTHTSK